MHESQKLDDVLDFSDTGKEVWANSAYRSAGRGAPEGEGLVEPYHRRAVRNRPLSERQKSANTTCSKVRARFEFPPMGGKIVRTIGIARARFKIGMMNLRYQWFRV